MHLKIDRQLPQAPSFVPPKVLALVALPAPTLLLYAPPQPPQKPEEPKKKFAFKANSQPTNTVEPVHLLDLGSSKWRTEETKGKFPSRREFPGTVCLGSCLMVYGGTQISPSKHLNDLYCLNLENWQWKKLFTMQAPPAHPRPIVLAHQEKLVVVAVETWVFNTKGINWSAESTDLPGGVWQKVAGCQLLFTPQCAYSEEQSIIVFGGEPSFAAASLNIEQRTTAKLIIEGLPQCENQKVEACTNSKGRGLLINQRLFCSVVTHQGKAHLAQWTESEDRIQGIASTDNRVHNLNYCFDAGNQLIAVELIIEASQEEKEQNTARQLSKGGVLRHSSILERESFEEGSSRPLPSPLTQGLSNPIINRLSPLLAREWLRRRVLEQKSKLLQDTIKKAEKMVLALCRYGDEEQKQLHIARVCQLRESLCKVLQSQSFVRKEMEERSGQKHLRAKALRDQQGLSFLDAAQF